jgi:hypothetical protein
MSRYYVELAAEVRGTVIPMAVEAANSVEGQKKAAKKFGSQFTPRYAEVLSLNADELFRKVDKWSKDEQLISTEIFHTTVAALLEEGADIAERQWSSRQFSLISPKAEYPSVAIDEMAVLMNCTPTEIHGCPYYLFNRNEARMFMALMIREGIARRLRELVKEN